MPRLLDPCLGAPLEESAADAFGALRADELGRDRQRTRTGREARGDPGGVDVALVRGDSPLEREPLLRLLQARHHRFHRSDGRIDVGDLVHQMQQIADGRADGERDVAGACLEHGVPGAHVMQAGDLLNDVANLGEDGLAIEVDDPLAGIVPRGVELGEWQLPLVPYESSMLRHVSNQAVGRGQCVQGADQVT